MRSGDCYKCIYACFDPEVWLRWIWAGVPCVPMCANHPDSPGRLREVTGVPCRNYRPKPAVPSGDIRWIPLGDGQYAIVDAADYDQLKRYKWHMCSGGYAARCENGKRVLMHRQIMKPPKGKVVDHANHVRWDNRRTNLRNCTHAQNQRNQRKQRGGPSPFKGVRYTKDGRRCYAKLVFERRQIWLGYFDDPVEAARAYDRAAVAYFGEFAELNFPEEWPPERRREVHEQWLKENGKGKGRRRKRKTASAKRHTKATARKPRKRPARKAKRKAGRVRRRAGDS